MAKIYYQASHEQFPPSELLTLAVQAEQAGFEGIHSSDHFYPWSERQGESGFAFAWLGAAMQATRLPFGMVCAPGQRYHPAIVAQAAATLCEMFPGRFWMSLGSGEALNEKITGEPWPDKDTRNRRLYESTQVIKRLLRGDTVNFRGTFDVENARLYTRPGEPPLIMATAVSEDTARWLAGWADGMITIHKPLEELQALVSAFRNHGGAGKPVSLKVQLSYAATYEEALEGACDQWRTNVLPPEQLGDFTQPSEFDRAAHSVTREQIESMVHVSHRPEDHIRWILQYRQMGFEHIVLHNVNRWQQPFIDAFGRWVLPEVKG